MAIAGLAVGLYFILFPRDETVIRRHFARLAEWATFAEGESPLRRLAKIDRIKGLLHRDVIMELRGGPSELGSLSGRDQVMEVVTAASAQTRQLRLQLVDPQVVVAPDRQLAQVTVVAIGEVNGEANVVVQEIRVTMVKVEGA